MLVPCKECGKEISDKAYVCPNCGNPNFKSKFQDAVTSGVSKAKNLDVSSKAKDASAKSKIKFAKFEIKSRAALKEHYKKVDYRNEEHYKKVDYSKEWMNVAKFVGFLIIPICVGILIFTKQI